MMLMVLIDGFDGHWTSPHGSEEEGWRIVNSLLATAAAGSKRLMRELMCVVRILLASKRVFLVCISRSLFDFEDAFFLIHRNEERYREAGDRHRSCSVILTWLQRIDSGQTAMCGSHLIAPLD